MSSAFVQKKLNQNEFLPYNNTSIREDFLPFLTKNITRNQGTSELCRKTNLVTGRIGSSSLHLLFPLNQHEQGKLVYQRSLKLNHTSHTMMLNTRYAGTEQTDVY